VETRDRFQGTNHQLTMPKPGLAPLIHSLLKRFKIALLIFVYLLPKYVVNPICRENKNPINLYSDFYHL
jgi:hypothetical protein